MGIELKALISNEWFYGRKIEKDFKIFLPELLIKINQLLKSGSLITLVCKNQFNFDCPANQIAKFQNFELIFTHWYSENN